MLSTEPDLKRATSMPLVSEAPDLDQHPSKFLPWVLTLSVAFGALLFGFHAGFSSPTNNAVVENIFGGNRTHADVAWSILNIGAMFGALICGSTASYFGRKPAILLNSVPYIVGAIMMATSNSNLPVIFTIGRFIVGIGVGYSSVIVPLYIAEIASPSQRGMLGCVNQLNITIGILVVSIMGMGLVSHPAWWRGMLVVSLVFVVCQFVPILILAPESPVWLCSQGLTEQAKSSLQRIRGADYSIHNELQSLTVNAQDALLRPRSSNSILYLATTSRLRRPILIGFGLMVLQQWSGINGVIFNMKSLFSSGSNDPRQVYAALLGVIIVAAFQVLSTGLAVALTERFGRRQLLLTSAIGMAISSVIMSISIIFSWTIYVKVFALCAYICLFSTGVGPLPWLLCSELLPGEIRSVAMGMATVLNWLCSFLVTLTFNATIEALSEHGLFLLYAAVCMLGALFVAIWVPETRGLSLQEIESMW